MVKVTDDVYLRDIKGRAVVLIISRSGSKILFLISYNQAKEPTTYHAIGPETVTVVDISNHSLVKHQEGRKTAIGIIDYLYIKRVFERES